ncbi:hypothetical protein WJX72_008645 [[Myrmecia] bisecta]|uniref:Fungal lipase-type domain-containing protein n=1 Tax=[Myrmecia] bisecta TaxID=41462 RepID=A0AAW1Q8A3_9CHLO
MHRKVDNLLSPSGSLSFSPSFEAYNSPYGIEGFKEMDLDGVETIYMDREFLEEVVHGVLEVHIRRITGLPLARLQPIEQVQCWAAVAPSAGRSLAIDLEPAIALRETAFLYVRDPQKQALQVVLRNVHADENTPEEDRVLGTARHDDLRSLCDGEVHELALQLQGRAEGASVHVAVIYTHHEPGSATLDDMVPKVISQMIADDWREMNDEDWSDEGSEDGSLDWRARSDAASSSDITDEGERPGDQDGDNSKSEDAAIAAGEHPDREPFQNWLKLRKSIMERALASEFAPVAYIMNEEADSEVWVYRNKEERQAVVAFRGTSSPRDMLTDMTLDMAAFNPGHRPDNKGPEELAAEEAQQAQQEQGDNATESMLAKLPGVAQAMQRLPEMLGKPRSEKAQAGWGAATMLLMRSADHNYIWVHRGFLQAYNSVHGRVLSMLDEMMDDGSEQPWHVFCTGHSMGGALATLCAFELAARDYPGPVPKPRITMYSYGQPRVGNIPFAEEYDRLVPDSWRIKNANDIVTQVPSLLGYRHIGMEVLVLPEGEVRISAESSDDVREGAVLEELLSNLKEGAFSDDPEVKEKFEAVVAEELKLWGALVKGHAISEHMEDFYHDIIKGVMDNAGDDLQATIKAVEDAANEAKDQQGEGEESRTTVQAQ